MFKLKSATKKTVGLIVGAWVMLSSAALAATNCDNTLGANGKVNQTKVQACFDQSPIVHDLQVIVNFLSAAVGVVVIAMLILGGINYITAGGDANASKAGKERITNALIALAVYLFAFAFLQWLIPGGIFK